jgi:hypothetical protein
VKAEEYLLSSAYFPPVQYMALFCEAKKVWIEDEENYLKQTYRNRCIILSANGSLVLSVPVLSGSSHKTCFKDIKIDYSKRWQQLHLRGINASYRASPYFEYFSHQIETVIAGNHKYLTDLNMNSLEVVTDILKISVPIQKTAVFQPVKSESYDFRYIISPKKEIQKEIFNFREYTQVFTERCGFVPGLSILDLIFNIGPESKGYLENMSCKPEPGLK